VSRSNCPIHDKSMFVNGAVPNFMIALALPFK
jgi:hypothetical protein